MDNKVETEEVLPDFGRAITPEWVAGAVNQLQEQNQEIVKAPMVITHLDSDDWSFVYVDGELVYSGHDNIPHMVRESIFSKLNVEYVNHEVGDADIAWKIVEVQYNLEAALEILRIINDIRKEKYK